LDIPALTPPPPIQIYSGKFEMMRAKVKIIRALKLGENLFLETTLILLDKRGKF